MSELYENFDPKKKSLYFKDDGIFDEKKLKKRLNSRVKEYAFTYCSLETSLGESAVSKVGNVGRSGIILIFFIFYIFIFFLLFLYLFFFI
jgi:hypothetical protein